MKKALWILCMLLALQACNTVSVTEQAGIDAIQEHYGGKVTYSKDEVAGERLFTVKLEGTARPYELQDDIEISGYHMAVIMYQHLNKTEREAYDGVKIAVTTDVGTKDEATETANFYFYQVKFAYRSYIEARREIGYFTDGKYDKFIERFQYGVQANSPADSLKGMMDALYAETGPLQKPVFLGIDTFHVQENFYGDFLFAFHSDNEEHIPMILVGLTYKINSNTGPFGYTIYSWGQQSSFPTHNWERPLFRVRARLD